MSANCEALAHKVFGDAEYILSQHASLQKMIPNQFSVVSLTLMLRLMHYRMVRRIHKLEAAMVSSGCPGTCDDFKTSFVAVVPALSRIADKERLFLNKMKKDNISSFVINNHEDMLADYEDMIEDFTISSNDEIHQLISDIHQNCLP